MYDCLPMYHSIGGVVAIGAMLVSGGSVRDPAGDSRRSRFWDDVVRGDCTLFQYIGELCRYLAASPPASQGAPHTASGSCCGNGLQRGCVGDIPAALRHPAHPRILRRDRRQSCRSTIARAGPAPSAACRRSWRIAFPVALIRCDARPASRCAMRQGSASAAQPTRPARRSADPASARTAGAAVRGLYRARGASSARSCATCSRPAIAGSAPAT